MPQTDAAMVAVTLAEIARIAGVGRAAVSNWRRRYDSFPAPIGGTDTSPLFSLQEVERWLRENNKFKSPAGALERLWPRFDTLGDRDATGRVIAALGLRAGGRAGGPVPDVTLRPPEYRLLDEALAVAEREGAAEVFHFLLDRWLTAHVRQIITTPAPLGRLMADIAHAEHSGPVRTVLDPACGTGTLLLAVAQTWPRKHRPRLVGQDTDGVLAAVTAARLAVEDAADAFAVTVGDSVRQAPPLADEVDVVLCSPPANERDWGHAELATDPRWKFGLPPRSESELAWVQQAIASLAPGGTGVLLLPPGVANRRAGRRIRAALLRAGALRAVIALPVGAAAPYGIGLHLWVVRPPDNRNAEAELLLVDTGDCRTTTSAGRPDIDWETIRNRVLAALDSRPVEGTRSVPVIELLDDEVDLSPARHVLPDRPAVSDHDLHRRWSGFTAKLERVTELSRALSALTFTSESLAASVTVAELERTGVLKMQAGRPVPEKSLRRGERTESAVRLLTVHDLTAGDESGGQWIDAAELAEAGESGGLAMARTGDVVVVTAQRAFDVWVHQGEPVVLGAQLLALRPQSDRIDPWYLAGCLRTSANARRAGGHASTSSRVDVRRLEMPRLPSEEQRDLGILFRQLAEFERNLHDLAHEGGALRDVLGELLAARRPAVPLNCTISAR